MAVCPKYWFLHEYFKTAHKHIVYQSVIKQEEMEHFGGLFSGWDLVLLRVWGSRTVYCKGDCVQTEYTVCVFTVMKEHVTQCNCVVMVFQTTVELGGTEEEDLRLWIHTQYLLVGYIHCWLDSAHKTW